jgi:hypothetical protein
MHMKSDRIIEPIPVYKCSVGADDGNGKDEGLWESDVVVLA